MQTQVDKIFGSGVVDLGTRPRENGLLDEIDYILGALRSGTAFAEATMEDGWGVFKSAKQSEANALKAFDASAAEATVIFGSTGVTRYGAVSVMERSLATSDSDYNAGNDGADPPSALADPIGNGQPNELGLVGAFSYSTIDDVQSRAIFCPNWGWQDGRDDRLCEPVPLDRLKALRGSYIHPCVVGAKC